MTIRVKYHNGVFEPLESVNKVQIEEGTELDIEIVRLKNNRLKGIIGLFKDLSHREVRRFEEAAQRRPLFDKSGSQ